MSEIKSITTDDLRDMEGKEGLILQGCGGKLEEWLDGINDMLTEDGILLEGTRFETALTFEHGGCTNLLFPLEGVKLDVGKLAMWRLKTHGQFAGTWLSDYVPNRLGGFRSQEDEKTKRPKMNLIGEDGNIFAIMGRASGLLKENGQDAAAKEMIARVTSSDSYDEALRIISEYVETGLTPAMDRGGSKKPHQNKSRNAEER